MFLLKLALRPWRRSPASQTLTVVTVGFLLFLSMFLYWIETSLGPVIDGMQGEQVITAYLSPEVARRDETAMVDRIRLSLGAAPEGPAEAEVRLVGPQGFLKEVGRKYPDLARNLVDLGDELSMLVPRYVTVNGPVGADAMNKIRDLAGIESVEASTERYRHAVDAFLTLQWFARILVGGLCLALFTSLVLLSRMNRNLFEDALAVLRLWGADALSLRVPSLVCSVGTGLAGGILAFIGWINVAPWLTDQVSKVSPALAHAGGPGFWGLPVLIGVGAALGMLGGLIGGQTGEAGRGARGA